MSVHDMASVAGAANQVTIRHPLIYRYSGLITVPLAPRNQYYVSCLDPWLHQRPAVHSAYIFRIVLRYTVTHLLRDAKLHRVVHPHNQR